MTSKPAKAPFRAIDPKQPEKPSPAELARFAKERGAPQLGAKPVQVAPLTKAEPAPPRETFRLNLEPPSYLRQQLRERAFRQECSILSIVLRALAKDGFQIEDIDLVADRRRHKMINRD